MEVDKLEFDLEAGGTDHPVLPETRALSDFNSRRLFGTKFLFVS